MRKINKWLAILLAVLLVAGCLPPGALATGTDEPEQEPLNAVYVSGSGDDESGDGSRGCPYASLKKAVDAADNGDTIYLNSDIEASTLALVTAKTITIDGNGHTVSRAANFAPANDSRGGYNPAMIEVGSGSNLTLYNITLDDNFRNSANATGGADIFREEGENEKYGSTPADVDNQDKVQDAIIAAYAGGGTITLGQGTTLQNFGGMSAVRIGGYYYEQEEAPRTSHLIMESGSQIIDTPDGSNSRKGGYAAIWNQGGYVEIQDGASIHDVSGRAVFAEDGSYTLVNGDIYNITSNSFMRGNSKSSNPSSNPNKGGGALNGFGGIAFAIHGNTQVEVGTTGQIYGLRGTKGTDVVIWGTGGTFTMREGSVMKGTEDDETSVCDANGVNLYLNGTISDFRSTNALFRTRNNGMTIEIGEKGIIEDCYSSDAAIMYFQGSDLTINIKGTLQNLNTSIKSNPVAFIAHTAGTGGTCTFTGTIQNITGSGLYISKPTCSLIMDCGTIANCTGYAVEIETKNNSTPVATLKSGTIENNNNGGAQVIVATTVLMTHIPTLR